MSWRILRWHPIVLEAVVLGGLLLARSGLAAPPTVSLVRGDLLVTDRFNDRVVRVDHRNGSVALFSPRQGQTNLLDFPNSIAIDAGGFVYVTNLNTSQLVVIDPYTGEQSVAQVCPTNQPCQDLDLGYGPQGIAVSYSSPGFSSLYEIAYGGLFGLSRSSVTQWSSVQVSDLSVMGEPPMIAPAAIAYSAQDQKVYVPSGSTLNEEDVSSPGSFTQDVSTGGPQIAGVAVESVTRWVYFAQWQGASQGCDQAQSGLRHYANGQVSDDSLGGLLHCPYAVAEGDPVQAGHVFYVLDQDSMTSQPSNPKLVTVVADGLPGAPQSELVDFTKISIAGVDPGGLAVSPADFVPEPGAGALAAVAAAALAARGRRRATRSVSSGRDRP